MSLTRSQMEFTGSANIFAGRGGGGLPLPYKTSQGRAYLYGLNFQKKNPEQGLRFR